MDKTKGWIIPRPTKSCQSCLARWILRPIRSCQSCWALSNKNKRVSLWRGRGILPRMVKGEVNVSRSAE